MSGGKAEGKAVFAFGCSVGFRVEAQSRPGSCAVTGVAVSLTWLDDVELDVADALLLYRWDAGPRET